MRVFRLAPARQDSPKMTWHHGSLREHPPIRQRTSNGWGTACQDDDAMLRMTTRYFRERPGRNARSARGGFCDRDYFSVRNGSAFSEPSRCLMRTCTLPSAASSSFLQAEESFTPSSKSLSESSSARSPFSSWSTMASSLLSDCSNDGMAVTLSAFRIQDSLQCWSWPALHGGRGRWGSAQRAGRSDKKTRTLRATKPTSATATMIPIHLTVLRALRNSASSASILRYFSNQRSAQIGITTSRTQKPIPPTAAINGTKRSAKNTGRARAVLFM